MKKIITWSLIVLWACGVASAQPTRNVLAHSAGEWIWFAYIGPAEPDNPLATGPREERTDVFVRQNGPGQAWQELPSVTGRATAMASMSSQLVLLMSDGQWFTVWSDGSASGQPLPAAGKILTIADDGENLWAIGAVVGGKVAADAAILNDLASTHPTTAPVMSAAELAALSTAQSPTTQASLESLVVFRQRQGRWMTFAELPHDVALLSEGASLAIVDGSPMVSYKVNKVTIKTLRWDARGSWTIVAGMSPPTDSVDDFKLFTDGSKPVLWWTRGNSPGQLIINASPPAQAIRLEWKGTSALDGLPAVVYAGGFIRVLGPHGKSILEQRYEANGEPMGAAAELVLPVDTNAASLMQMVEAVFLIAVAFSVGASIYRQWTLSQAPQETEPPTPASLLPRLGAGIIDLLPVFAVVVYLYVSGVAATEFVTAPSQAVIELCAGAVAVYLLHTTVVELLSGRTPGKWVFGLRVVTTEGKVPAAGQILIRNLLRLVDPLVMIVLSPLRQRSADVVAGTMVVAAQEQPPATDADSGNEPAEKDSK